jgi:hypothetical protein
VSSCGTILEHGPILFSKDAAFAQYLLQSWLQAQFLCLASDACDEFIVRMLVGHFVNLICDKVQDVAFPLSLGLEERGEQHHQRDDAARSEEQGGDILLEEAFFLTRKRRESRDAATCCARRSPSCCTSLLSRSWVSGLVSVSRALCTTDPPSRLPMVSAFALTPSLSPVPS